jgi:hypothetical protein
MAKRTLQGIKRLSKKAGKHKELRATLTGTEAMAYGQNRPILGQVPGNQNVTQNAWFSF